MEGYNMSIKYAENIFEKELIGCPLDFHTKGLQQTASGYGNKLTTPYKVHYEGRLRRVYATCHSNVSSLYIVVRGEKLYLRV